MAYNIKPTYEPMTFQEMLQPYAVYGAERDRQEEAYMKLLEDARSLEDLKDSDVDKEEYNKYVNFKNRINSMVNEIATTGLSRQTRSNLSKYRAEYQTNFANMVDKIKRRGELVKQQREYLSKNPNTFFDIDYSETPASKVVDSSSYIPYDMNEAANNIASKVYTMMSSKGDDVTEEDMDNIIASERQKYGYDNLDDRKKAMVDNAISLGIMTADKTYTDNINKQAIENAKRIKAEADAYKSMYGKYKGTGAPVGRTSGSSSSKTNKISYSFNDGTTVEFNKSKNINGETVWTYKGYDGKTRTITQQQVDNFEGDNNLSAEIYKNVSGISGMSQKNVFGKNITVVVDVDGNTKVKNKDGKLVIPKSYDDKGLYMAFTGEKEEDLKPFMRNQNTVVRYKPDGNTLPTSDYNSDYKDNSGDGKKYIPISDFNINISSNTPASSGGYSEFVSKYEDAMIRSGNLGNKIDEFIKRQTGSDSVEDGLRMLYSNGFDINIVMYAKHGNPNKRAYLEISLKYVGSQGRISNTQQTNNQPAIDD